MNLLAERLHHIIALEGPITFARFMDTALYDPEFGYYGAGKAEIGRLGDFYTSVSVGPLFGKMLTRQIVEFWELLNRPADWTLVEQGAFNGQLAFDVLKQLQTVHPECSEATRLTIVEPFQHFQTEQQKTLETFRNKVAWVSEASVLPPFCGIHYSNELLDAFPVHCLEKVEGRWMERRVQSDSLRFSWIHHPIDSQELTKACDRLPDVPDGFKMEVSLAHRSWIDQWGGKLERGYLLTFDYGMSAVELGESHRKDGTLSSYWNHQRQNPLENPGNADITAQVNFTSVATTALTSGWALEGYTDQHRFFTGLAPLFFEDKNVPLSIDEQRERLAFRTLTHPQMMGNQFKALCLSRNLPTGNPPTGFKFARNPFSSLGLTSVEEI